MSSSILSEAPRWLVIGADGLIGRHLYAALQLSGAQVQGTSRRWGSPHHFVDLAADPGSWQLPEADIVIIAAAVPRIAECESNPTLTRRINVDAALSIAAQVWPQQGHIVFLSSSGVFDGVSNIPTPTTPPQPLNAYGQQKMQAEHALQTAAGTQHGLTIIRPTKILGEETPILREWQAALGEGQAIHPHAWRWMAPISVAWAVRAMLTIAAARVPGIWHLSAARDINFAEFAQRWAAVRGYPATLVQPEESIEKPVRARLDMRSTTDRFALAPPSLNETLSSLRGHP